MRKALSVLTVCLLGLAAIAAVMLVNNADCRAALRRSDELQHAMAQQSDRERELVNALADQDTPAANLAADRVRLAAAGVGQRLAAYQKARASCPK